MRRFGIWLELSTCFAEVQLKILGADRELGEGTLSSELSR